VLLSVALTSNIGGTLEMIAPLASNQSSWRKTDSLWQVCYWTALAVVFTWAIWQRFALPLTPIADPDTWGYLSPALRKLTGAEFGHSQGRNFLYPGFLYLVLRCFGDFRAIGVVQHLLGLAAGGLFLLTWRHLRVFVPDSSVNPSLHDAFGLAGAAIYLLASDTIRIETQLRPEGVCAFLIGINLYFAIQFVSCSFLERRRTGAIVCGSATVLTSLLLASAKPSFWFAAIVVMVPVTAFFSATKLGAAKNRARPRYGIDCIASAVARVHPQSQGRGEPDFLAHNALRYSRRSDSRSNGRGPQGKCQPSIFQGLAGARLCRIE
jgi:hypothetical protein